MTQPNNTRRIEQLEQRLAAQDLLIRGLIGREKRGTGKRWAYQAQTIRTDGAYPSGSYPTSGSTFALKFLDREFTATAGGAGTVTEHPRSATEQVVGRTINGQWVLEDERVLVFFQPPPPGTTGKGKWWIQAQPYYYGKLTTAMEPNESASMKVWYPTSTGWAASNHVITVWDFFLRFAEGVVDLPIGTGLRVDWVQSPVTPANSRFVVSESSCQEEDFFA
jgi:hypothetical protein